MNFCRTSFLKVTVECPTACCLLFIPSKGYILILSMTFLDKNYHHPHSQDHRRHFSSSDLHHRPSSQNSFYRSSNSQPIKDYSNNSVQSPLALHSTNNIQASKASLNKSNSVTAASSSYNNSNSRAMNSNSRMANDHQKHMPSSAPAAARNSKHVNSNNLKKKIISPEEVIQLFSVPQHHSHPQHPHLTGFLGHNHSAGRQRTSSGSAIINESQRGRKSPSSASSPPTMTHQVSFNELG